MAKHVRDRKPWTVLVYMVADDPQGGELLDQQANRELDRIVYSTLGADPEKLHVAVQIDYRSQRDVWRRVIGEGSWRHPESDAASPETLYGFFRWAKVMCPADRYVLMFWGHSRSLFGLFMDPDPWTYVAQTLTLTELRDALKDATAWLGRELDLVVFKDCFMSTLETASELKGLASYLVASQALVPIEGWPYSKMFETLIANKDNPRRAAVQLVDELERHYADQKNRGGFPVVPFSVLDTAKAPAVNVALASIVSTLTDSGADRELKKARKMIPTAAPGKPGDTSLLDVRALCRKLRSLPPLAAQMTSLETAVFGTRSNGDATAHDGLVVHQYPQRNTGTRVFGGVSVFHFPSKLSALKASLVARLSSRKIYDELQFKDSTWAKLALEAMPLVEAPTTERYAPERLPELARQLLPLAVLEQLQNRGLFESLQREAFEMARGTVASIVNGGFGSEPSPVKPTGFIELGTVKPTGFLELGAVKPTGFIELGTVKPTGFASNGGERVILGLRPTAPRRKLSKPRTKKKASNVVRLRDVKDRRQKPHHHERVAKPA